MKLSKLIWKTTDVMDVTYGYMGRIHVFTTYRLAHNKYGLMSPMPQFGTHYYKSKQEAIRCAPHLLKDYLNLLLDNKPTTCYTYSVKHKRCKHDYRSDGRSYCYCIKCGKDKYNGL